MVCDKSCAAQSGIFHKGALELYRGLRNVGPQTYTTLLHKISLNTATLSRRLEEGQEAGFIVQTIDNVEKREDCYVVKPGTQAEVRYAITPDGIEALLIFEGLEEVSKKSRLNVSL
jgi:DNA-binding HxlR family transcriptional regulator